MSDFSCTDRACIVTGAGRGIGREYAPLLARDGAKVVVNDVPATSEEAEALARKVLSDATHRTTMADVV